MNVAVLMARDSPWSQQVVRRLAENGHRVAAVEIDNNCHSGTTAPVDWLQEFGPCEHPGSIQSCPINIGRRFLKGPKGVQLAQALPAIVQRHESEIVLTMYAGSLAMGAWLSRTRPYAIYVVGSDVLFMRGIYRFLSRIALNAAGVVFVNGTYLAEKTRAMAPRARVVPLLIGVDTDRFAPLEKPARPVRVVCTRAFKPVYDNERLIDALRLMGDSAGDLTMTFTSAGPLLDRVRAAARDRLSPAMCDRVRFLGGVSDDVLRETVQQSHIYVSMSLSDGTSTSLLEAMACGVFPIVSDIPQNREWIDPATGNGLLVPVGRPEALAEALGRAIADPTMRDRAAGPNRARVVERACSRTSMKQLSEILESVVRTNLPGESYAHR